MYQLGELEELPGIHLPVGIQELVGSSAGKAVVPAEPMDPLGEPNRPVAGDTLAGPLATAAIVVALSLQGWVLPCEPPCSYRTA